MPGWPNVDQVVELHETVTALAAAEEFDTTEHNALVALARAARAAPARSDPGAPLEVGQSGRGQRSCWPDLGRFFAGRRLSVMALR